VNTVHWFDASSSGNPVNNPVTLAVHSPGYIFAADSIMRSSANFVESEKANPLDAEPETHFNAK